MTIRFFQKNPKPEDCVEGKGNYETAHRGMVEELGSKEGIGKLRACIYGVLMLVQSTTTYRLLIGLFFTVPALDPPGGGRGGESTLEDVGVVAPPGVAVPGLFKRGCAAGGME